MSNENAKINWGLERKERMAAERRRRDLKFAADHILNELEAIRIEHLDKLLGVKEKAESRELIKLVCGGSGCIITDQFTYLVRMACLTEQSIRKHEGVRQNEKTGAYHLWDRNDFFGTSDHMEQLLSVAEYLLEQEGYTYRTLFCKGKDHLELSANGKDGKAYSFGLYYRDKYNGDIINNQFDDAYKRIEQVEGIIRENYVVLENEDSAYNLRVPSCKGVFGFEDGELFAYSISEEE